MTTRTGPDTALDERRARFVHEAARLENEAAGRPINPEPWDERDPAFRTSFKRSVARQCGDGRLTSPEALHEAWVQEWGRMGWTYAPVRDLEKKTHPDMVPFAELPLAEQEKDWVFFMLCEIARRIR